MKKTVSQLEFSKRIGKSHAYVYKLVQQEKLTLTKIKGKKKPQIDLTGVATLEYLKTLESQIIDPPDEPEYQELEEPQTRQAGNNQSGLPKFKPTSKRELDEEKIKQQIEKLEIENGMKRGTLIRKDLVIYAFSRLYHIDENQFKALNIRSSPKLSAVVSEENELKVIEILKFLDRTADKNAKLEILKILNSGQTEREVKFTQIIEDDTGAILLNIQAVFDEFLKKTELEGKI